MESALRVFLKMPGPVHLEPPEPLSRSVDHIRTEPEPHLNRAGVGLNRCRRYPDPSSPADPHAAPVARERAENDMDIDAKPSRNGLDGLGLADLGIDVGGVAADFPAERRFLLAILENAIHSYQTYALSWTRRGRRLFREVDRWFNQHNAGAIVSFEYVCDVLGIDPGYVRSGLERWRDREFRGTFASLSFEGLAEAAKLAVAAKARARSESKASRAKAS
jgi:hypothetical protein